MLLGSGAMADRPLQAVLTHLRRALDAHGTSVPTDAELLGRYVTARDEAAFELLVWRHGTMVLHACRRLLGRAEDAEDAFQATFLALVRQAKSIRKHESVAGWLHRVACRMATRARAERSRRADCEKQSAAANGHNRPYGSTSQEPDPALWAEVRAVLDAEVNRLPAKLRVPFILCYFEGLSNEAAARQLGCPKGTVLSRLARARERLRGQLLRRGLTLSAAVLAAGLAQEAALAAPALSLVMITVKAAMLVAAGNAMAGVVSAPVAALTNGVLKAMFLTKIKTAIVVLIGVGLLAATADGILYHSQAAAQDAPEKATASPAQPATKDQKGRDASDELEAAKQKAKEREIDLRHSEAELGRAKAVYEIKKAVYEEARLAYEKAAKAAGAPLEDQSTRTPRPVKPTPIKPTPVNTTPPADAAKAFTLTGGAQSDLIHLATTYIDAVRDMEIAKVRVHEPAPAVLPAQTREINRINLVAAQRKVDLLKAIVEGTLKAAESELKHARRVHQHGLIPETQVTAAETKVRLLQLILDGTK